MLSSLEIIPSTESRTDLLAWINACLPRTAPNGHSVTPMRKVEQCGSGVPYVLMLPAMLPQPYAPLSSSTRVKVPASLEFEAAANLKIMTDALHRNGVARPEVLLHDTNKLIKGNFQANLTLLQWFKGFYDALQECGVEPGLGRGGLPPTVAAAATATAEDPAATATTSAVDGSHELGAHPTVSPAADTRSTSALSSPPPAPQQQQQTREAAAPQGAPDDDGTLEEAVRTVAAPTPPHAQSGAIASAAGPVKRPSGEREPVARAATTTLSGGTRTPKRPSTPVRAGSQRGTGSVSSAPRGSTGMATTPGGAKPRSQSAGASSRAGGGRGGSLPRRSTPPVNFGNSVRAGGGAAAAAATTNGDGPRRSGGPSREGSQRGTPTPGRLRTFSAPAGRTSGVAGRASARPPSPGPASGRLSRTGSFGRSGSGTLGITAGQRHPGTPTAGTNAAGATATAGATAAATATNASAMTAELQQTKMERQFYYDKLRMIESLVSTIASKELSGRDVAAVTLARSVRDVLYATN